MNVLIISLFACFAIVASAPAETLIKVQELEINPDGTFRHAYELDDGTAAQAVGDADKVNGNYMYISPEGEKVEVTYLADGLGYHPQGSQIPAQLQKVLSYIRTNLKPE
ncbi:pupal cuticle protein Edg-78E-like [Toxorhynchites rutilus septentrionalis]|uniref:pupal cuticle protein Edg-78E-like n=1 Tax=Toxorhynchites rutilus septentrionalis TaxID=329112 RepID=UPI0024786F0A|nr:pupal cuticle protein Edg-78E-like [Toxorhynchites rutilus septentrionalis]